VLRKLAAGSAVWECSAAAAAAVEVAAVVAAVPALA
jgi:hypothetical protein